MKTRVGNIKINVSIETLEAVAKLINQITGLQELLQDIGASEEVLEKYDRQLDKLYDAYFALDNLDETEIPLNVFVK